MSYKKNNLPIEIAYVLDKEGQSLATIRGEAKQFIECGYLTMYD